MDLSEKNCPRIRGTQSLVQEAARALRGSTTPAEQVLWEALRNRKVAGLKFRRQHAVGPFVLDFFCRSCSLAIELDGSVHDGEDAREHDTLREEHLQRYGYRILRFRNEDVLSRLPQVLARIAQAAQEPPPSPPLPELGEGAGG